MSHLRSVRLAALLVTALSLVAHAAKTSLAPDIQDDAGFFTAGAVEQAETALTELNSRHNVRVVIETVSEIPAPKAEEVRGMNSAERQKFFADWARQKATVANTPDVYVLISKDPSHLRIRTSPEFQNRGYSGSQGRELTSVFLSGFRQGQYDAALEKAVSTLTSQVSHLRPAGERTAAAPAAGEGGSSWFSGSGLLIILAVAGLGILALVVLSSIFRSAMGGGPGYGGAGPGWGGGGFFGSLLGTIGGVMAGSWLYDQFFGQSAHAGDTTGSNEPVTTPDDHRMESGDYGGDWGDGGDFGGGDFGDFGGGDFGGGDF